ncbi:hypothetical protein NDU88_000995 [Pleurodeles waltl]|uniref:Uncharacterized protein n=1 Tax=Pleurodeles waltl TaxID=8319 RepID=A0AAV7V6N2_PLEWA|nr:hypothetical protein NDU88_000995 [Pleurodeles waltl]
MSQQTVPRNYNSDHRVKLLRGQRPPEEGYLACHRQGRPNPGGPPQTDHPLPEKMGGHSPLEQEDGGGSAGDGLPTWEGCPYVECTGHQDSQCGTEPQHSQSPLVKHQKLDSARRERGKTPASKAAHKGPGESVDSAVTPLKVGKGQKKSPKSGRSSTAERTAFIPAAQEATASPIVTGQEATARVTAQEASPIVTGQEATTRVTAQEARPIVTGQEATASHSPAGQEGPQATAQLTHEGPPATALLGNEGPPWQAPLNRPGTAEQGKDRHGMHR